MTVRPRLTLLLAFAAVAATSADALAGITTIAAQGDTWVTDRYGTRNFDGETAMRVHSNPVKRGLVRFEVGALDGPVEKAVLRVYAETGAPGGFRIYAMPATWNAATVTHNNAPAPGALLATVAAFTTQGSWREYDVTAAVPGAGARAFMITAPAAETDIAFTTTEGGRAPELVITTLTAPVSTAPPTIAGTARVGSTLSASPGSWSGATPIAYAYRWRRCNPAGAACADIAGATAASYALVQADLGATLRVQVTASNSHGSATAVSAQTGTIAAASTSPPQPPPTGGCSRADATGCAAVAGSRISLLNDRFNCREPLAAIAARNPIGAGPGTLPLLVEVGFTTYVELVPAVIDLREDCVGDGNDETIDLILQVEGDGRTVGGTIDAIKVRLTASDIQLTGYANCGPRGIGADGLPNTIDDSHQDGAQIQGGYKVEFIDFEWGDWETNTATCQGAAGTFVPGSVNSNPVVDMACIRCKSVSCNHGMHFSVSTGALVADSRWRTGNPADRTIPLANGHIGLCQFGSPACTMGVNSMGAYEAIDYVITGNLCDRWPYGDDS